MRGVNQAVIVGYVGDDPKVFPTRDGDGKVARIRVATNEEWKDKETGEKKSITTWHNVVAYGGLAEIVASYVAKGQAVAIVGSFRSDKYTDKEGVERISYDIEADKLEMITPGRGAASPQT